MATELSGELDVNELTRGELLILYNKRGASMTELLERATRAENENVLLKSMVREVGNILIKFEDANTTAFVQVMKHIDELKKLG